MIRLQMGLLKTLMLATVGAIVACFAYGQPALGGVGALLLGAEALWHYRLRMIDEANRRWPR